MKKALVLALSAFALVSGTSAQAEAMYGYTINGGTQVLTQPAVVAGTAACPAVVGQTGWVGACQPLFGDQTHFDNDMDIDNRRGLLSGLFGRDRQRLQVNTYAAVIPGTGATTRVCGQQRANELFSLRLFGFGLGFGKVNPDLDMRPAAHAGD